MAFPRGQIMSAAQFSKQTILAENTLNFKVKCVLQLQYSTVVMLKGKAKFRYLRTESFQTLMHLQAGKTQPWIKPQLPRWGWYSREYKCNSQNGLYSTILFWSKKCF